MISIYPTPGAKVNAKMYQTVPCGDFKTLVKYALSHQWSPIIWQNNIRNSKNFISVEFCVLDIDGGLTLNQVSEIITKRNIKSVVMATENHQLSKKNVICDRMRIIMRWDKTIYDSETYKFNYKAWNKEFSGDKSTIDCGRHFKPCRYILGVYDGELLSVTPPIIHQNFNKLQFFDKIEYLKSRKLPQKVTDFIDNGILLGNGRQDSFFRAACILRSLGMSQDEASRILIKAPVNTIDFNFKQEFEHGISSAFRYR